MNSANPSKYSTNIKNYLPNLCNVKYKTLEGPERRKFLTLETVSFTEWAAGLSRINTSTSSIYKQVPAFQILEMNFWFVPIFLLNHINLI